jgi:hypothetical protein
VQALLSSGQSSASQHSTQAASQQSNTEPHSVPSARGVLTHCWPTQASLVQGLPSSQWASAQHLTDRQVLLQQSGDSAGHSASTVQHPSAVLWTHCPSSQASTVQGFPSSQSASMSHGASVVVVGSAVVVGGS